MRWDGALNQPALYKRGERNNNHLGWQITYSRYKISAACLWHAETERVWFVSSVGRASGCLPDLTKFNESNK